MKRKILYVEDEPFLGKIVKETLELRGFEVLHKKDGNGVRDALQSFIPDICVLDVMLPNADGFELGTIIRTLAPRVPVIFLTAKSQTQDILKGFSSGGTDYMKKPFSMEELIARINNQLQLINVSAESTAAKQEEEIMLGRYCFSPGKYELKFEKKVVKLSHRESQVLSLFAAHQNQTIDRQKLLLAVWGDDSFFNSRTLDVYIRKLREYLSKDPSIEIITLKGKGYHFVVKK